MLFIYLYIQLAKLGVNVEVFVNSLHCNEVREQC